MKCQICSKISLIWRHKPRFVSAIQRSHREMPSDGVIFMHDNVRPHTIHQTQEYLQILIWKSESPLYSPDLVTWDYFFFQKLKITYLKHVPNKGLLWNQHSQYSRIGSESLNFNKKRLNKLALRSHKHLNKLLDYVEKWLASVCFNFLLYFLSIINNDFF